MTLYTLALFLHVTGALGLFVAIGLEWASLPRLRRAASVEQAHTWLGVLGALGPIGGPSALTLLVTGIYMMLRAWRGAAWPGIGLLAMVLIVVLGGVLTGRRVTALRHAVPAESAPLPQALRERLHDPVLVLSARLRAALALGVVFIMCTKPGVAGSLTAMGAALVIGLVAGLAAFPVARAAAPRTE
jgi:hypothetical protein